VYITPFCPDDPCDPNITKFGMVGGMDDVVSRTIFGVDRLRRVGSAGS
jgi:hypothetical protein